MNSVKILLIEDDQKIRNFITLALETSNYTLLSATNGKNGILEYCMNLPDIILLDLGLPDMDGIEIIHKIREVSQVPILVVSAREMDNDKIEALDAGANDYVTKPFSMGELMARIRVMERFIVTETFPKSNDILHIDDLLIDTVNHRIYKNDVEIHLTPLEYKLLILLSSNPGKVFTHNQIQKCVWGYHDETDTKSIRVCMSSLRRKIEPDPSHPKYILTEIGIGYRFIDIY